MRILDVGCGDGVHAEVLGGIGVAENLYFGIDLSLEGIRLAKERTHGKGETWAEFQVGNALLLPYQTESFDVVFSYGTVAYTRDPERAFGELIRVCKPGGLVGIWIYPEIGGTRGRMFQFARMICWVIGRRLSKLICYCVVPFLSFLPVRSGVNLSNSTWKQCLEVVEVNLLPETLHFYALDVVLSWFKKHGMSIQLIDQERPVAIWAIK